MAFVPEICFSSWYFVCHFQNLLSSMGQDLWAYWNSINNAKWKPKKYEMIHIEITFKPIISWLLWSPHVGRMNYSRSKTIICVPRAAKCFDFLFFAHQLLTFLKKLYALPSSLIASILFSILFYNASNTRSCCPANGRARCRNPPTARSKYVQQLQRLEDKTHYCQSRNWFCKEETMGKCRVAAEEIGWCRNRE